MRTRIALATAVAVTVFAVPAVLVSLFSGNPAWAKAVRHEAVAVHRTAKPGPRVMSFDQARQLAGLATYADAVTLAQEESYLKEVAFFDTLEQQNFYNGILRQEAQAAAARAAESPPATPVAPPAATTPPAGGGSDATSTATADWACIRAHESGGNYGEGGGGAYQFEFSTWHALTGLPSPAEDYPASVQDSAALALFAQRGWEPWSTRSVCGL